MSDSYLPDNERRDILLSLEELAAKKLPHAPTFRKAADEITRLRADLAAVTEGRDAIVAFLRADLAAVTEERDRMREALAAEKSLTNACERVNRMNDELLDKVRSLREALKPFADAADDFIAEKHDAHRAIVTLGDLRRARAAFEGVTEPASPWRDIESAPKDGTYIDLWANNERISDARWNDRQRRWEAWSLGDYDGMEFISIAGNPTHWMPLPEPPR